MIVLSSSFQGVRATSTGGSEGLGIHRTHPHTAGLYGGLEPVHGGRGEQRDDIADPSIPGDTAYWRRDAGAWWGKGVKFSVCTLLALCLCLVRSALWLVAACGLCGVWLACVVLVDILDVVSQITVHSHRLETGDWRLETGLLCVCRVGSCALWVRGF